MSQRRLFYGWIVLAAIIPIIGIGVGSLFSLAVFLKPMEDTMGWSRSALSAVALVNWLAMGMRSLLWGVLADRIRGRGVAMAGRLLRRPGLGLPSPAPVPP